MTDTGGPERVVLVTGAARRVGAAIATALAGDGWTICLHYHASADDAQALAHRLRAAGGTCHLVDGDLADSTVPERVIADVIAKAGRCDALINNASLFRYDALADFAPAALRAHMDVNLVSPILLARALAARLAPGQEGVVVNLIDQKVFNPNPDYFSYTLSKVALQGATELLALALAPRVRVAGVAPGITLPSGPQGEAEYERAARATPLGRSSTPEDIANAVRFVLTTPSFTGRTLIVDGGESLSKRRRDVAFDPDVNGPGPEGAGHRGGM